MSEAQQPVFLSYASQDAESVRRIAEALRVAGVEVWFDQNELVGGDAWHARAARSFGFGISSFAAASEDRSGLELWTGKATVV